MMNNRVIYTYINMYLNNSNDVDKSFYAAITGMITYTICMKLQKYIHYRREDLAYTSALTMLPTPQIS
jgi:hypothetical protein